MRVRWLRQSGRDSDAVESLSEADIREDMTRRCREDLDARMTVLRYVVAQEVEKALDRRADA